MSKDTIVVLTRDTDYVADHLVRSMEKRNIAVFRFDTFDFPLQLTLDASFKEFSWSGTLSGPQGTVALEDIKSIWYHRPREYRIDDRLPDPYKEFAEGEAIRGFGGILRSIDCFWVSHPDTIRAANYKPLQLKLAHEIGFITPRTIITNDPHALLQFYEECERKMICKAISNGFIAVGGDQYHAVYTSVVTSEIVQYAENVRHTATLFQEIIPKELELRVTVIGNTALTVAIHSQHSERTRVDWRRYYPDLTYSRFSLPPDIETKCLSLVKRLNLNYGCLDLILTPVGDFVFLEINSSGQYRWLEEATNLPFTDTLVDILVAGSIV